MGDYWVIFIVCFGLVCYFEFFVVVVWVIRGEGDYEGVKFGVEGGGWVVWFILWG